MRKLLLTLLLTVLSIHLFSQIIWSDYKNSSQFNDAFSAIAFDLENKPWIGTLFNGIHYYHGSGYIDFNTGNSPILHNKVYDLLYDKQEEVLWIATLRGINTLKENFWTNYTTENSNLPSNVVYCFSKEEGGRIWIGTDNGVLDGLNGKVYNSSNTPMNGESVFRICVDSKGNKWFTTEREIARFDGKTWQIYSSENSGLPQMISLCIAEDKDGLIWATFGEHYSGKIASFDGESWTIYDKSILYNLTSRAGSIVPLSDGTIWFGTHDKGLIRYKDSKWEAFDTENSEIPINQIICMQADSEENLWLGHRHGLTKLQFENVVEVDYFTKRDFAITPNPIQHKATINIPDGIEKTVNLLVYNINGKLVRRYVINEKHFTFERGELKSGVYIMKISFANREITKKLIIN